MGMQIAFWVLSILAVTSAIGVIWQKNLFRAALLLVLCFIAVAGTFVTLSADFLAVAQLIINAGAVAILLIMAIMLTRKITTGSPSNKLSLPALAVTAVLTAAIIIAATSTSWPLSSLPPAEPTTSALADILFKNEGFIFLVQLAAVLVLTTVIGAIILLKEEE
ncbi:MAG: NADH-quinone oxidoreductase subunit J [Dehalococcoidales bacterium]|nr:NADH-quinone oxidoreductase subunit J [Dehalococcoidales bacterium]